MKRIYALALAVMLGCTTGSDQHARQSESAIEGLVEVRLEPAFPHLTFRRPVLLLQAPGDSERTFVVEQQGTVQAIAADGAVSPFVDIASRVLFGGEAGLLGMAFHPDWPNTPEAFLSYSTSGGGADHRSMLARLRSSDGGKTLDPTSETVVLTFDQPFRNHNGGNIAFGPDGYLYFGTGDGGSGGDPRNFAQNLQVPLGKMLRIDVVGSAPYGIPPDNPLVEGGGLPEIYAWGLRNPWRFSFDRETGELFAGDVGQNAWEEIDIIVKGGNYGWKIREGAHCFGASSCPSAGLVEPIAEYRNPEAGRSITGGFVYRGKALPKLAGTYLYADFISGTLWGLSKSTSGTYEPRVLIESTGALISSFGEGHDGELYALDYGAGTILKIVAP